MSLDVSMCRDALRKTFSKYAGVDILKAIICERDPESCRNSNNYLHCMVYLQMLQTYASRSRESCCRQRACVTREEFFQSAVFDMSVPSIATVNHSNMFADDPEYTPFSYRKATYH